MTVIDLLGFLAICFGAICLLKVQKTVALLEERDKEVAALRLKLSERDERPMSYDAQELLHDLTAHGKAVVLLQRVGLDEIFLRIKRQE